MNFKKISFLSVSLLTIVLSACGYGLKEYYEGDAYNSGNFQKDYYHVWNSKIDPNNSKNQIVDSHEYALNDIDDYIFESYNYANFRLCDEEAQKTLTYI